ncbi:MAG TPA: helix-turn-helix domain-containing protein, partial [Mycobacterium sp.]|nr:helix-turn-helix domain-containing protein [Mycobacterium sp.]
MATSHEQLSGSQARTRAAILAATASVLARNRSATLPDIADAAGVGRTTLHRYFADRERLIQEATVDSI